MKKYLSLFVSLFILMVCVSFSVLAYADDDVIHLTDSKWCHHTDYPGCEKYNDNLKNIDKNIEM